MDTPNTLDTMLKDIEGMNASVDYFTTNINRIPPMLQIKFLEETLASQRGLNRCISRLSR